MPGLVPGIHAFLTRKTWMAGTSAAMTWHRIGLAMPDIAQLEKDLLAAVASANDEAALEAARVAALGKSGQVTALLKALGAMTPDERKAVAEKTRHRGIWWRRWLRN